MQFKLTTLVVAAAKKGVIMEINNMKKYLSRIRVTFIMLLFAMCVMMNVFFCSANNFCELFDKTAEIETRAASESIAANEGGDNTAYFQELFLNPNNSYDETIAKNICSIVSLAAIPNGNILLLFLSKVFLFFLVALSILLPDGWTLINQKVRLDN